MRIKIFNFMVIDGLNLLFLAHTLDIFGTILLGVTVLGVHWHVVKEHKIDAKVLRFMKKERILGMIGITMIVTGYLIMIFSRYQ